MQQDYYAHPQGYVIETMMMSLFYEGKVPLLPAHPPPVWTRMDLTVIRPIIFVGGADVFMGFQNKYQLQHAKPCPMDPDTPSDREYDQELIHTGCGGQSLI